MASDDESPFEWCERTFGIGVAEGDPCQRWCVQVRRSASKNGWIRLMDILRPPSPAALEAVINYVAAYVGADPPPPHVRVTAWRYAAHHQDKTRTWERPGFDQRHYADLATGCRARLNPKLPMDALERLSGDLEALVILASDRPSSGTTATVGERKPPPSQGCPGLHSPPALAAASSHGPRRRENLEQILRFCRGDWETGIRAFIRSLSNSHRELLLQVLDEAQWSLLATLVGGHTARAHVPDATAAHDRPSSEAGSRLHRPAELLVRPDVLERLEELVEAEIFAHLCGRLRTAARLFESMTIDAAAGGRGKDASGPADGDDDR